MKFHKFLFLTLLATLLALGSISQAAAPTPNENGAQYRMKIVNAPTNVQVCREFTVDVVVEPTVEGTFYDEIQINVIVDTDYMEIVGAAPNMYDDWLGVSSINPEQYGLHFYADQVEDPDLYGSYIWVTLTIHCKGPGTSDIEFVPEVCLVARQRDTTKEFVLEFEDATVNQFEMPPPRGGISEVGGVYASADKMVILAPYLAVVGLISAFTTSTVIIKRRKSRS